MRSKRVLPCRPYFVPLPCHGTKHVFRATTVVRNTDPLFRATTVVQSSSKVLAGHGVISSRGPKKSGGGEWRCRRASVDVQSDWPHIWRLFAKLWAVSTRVAICRPPVWDENLQFWAQNLAPKRRHFGRPLPGSEHISSVLCDDFG